MGMPRLILEYVLAQHGEGDDALTRCVIRCVRCVLHCIGECVKMMTDMALINVAISGRAMCAAGGRAVELMAKYPRQVLLDRLASWSVKVLACILVPAVLVGVVMVKI